MRTAIATAAAFEVVISAIGLLSERLFDYAIYFHPHVAIVLAEQALIGSDRPGWSTLAIGTFTLAAMPAIGRSRKAALAYVVVQSVYAIGAGLIFLIIAVVNMSASHGPSRAEVVLPAAVLVLTVAIPVAVTIGAIGRSSPRV